jgi:predicted metal-dependent phosphoesterase TrpH
MNLKVELHTHTKYSHDSLLNKYFYLFMLKVKQIKIVGITDHNEIEGALEYKIFLGKFGIKVIVGEEIFTTKGEIIGLFLYKKIKQGLSPRETMFEIKKQGGLVYIPHPYDEKRYKTVLPENEIKNNIDLIDIIEVHNGRNIKEYYSEYQLKIAGIYPHITQVVGSDAHTFIEIGRNYNIIKEFNTKEEFIKNLKEAKLVKRNCLKTSHHMTKLVRVIKLLKKGQLNELYRIINKRFKRTKSKIS